MRVTSSAHRDQLFSALQLKADLLMRLPEVPLASWPTEVDLFASRLAAFSALDKELSAILVLDLCEHVRRCIVGDDIRPPTLVNRGPEVIATELNLELRAWLDDNTHAIAVRDKTMSSVVAFIDANLTATLTVKALASAASLSRAHFSRVFKRYASLPPHAFVTQRRIHHAKQRLREGWKVEAAMISVGYRNKTNFYREFKRSTGMLPGEFRGKHAPHSKAPE